MSYRLACELSDLIAGIAPVTANLSSDLYEICEPENVTDILVILGTDDPLMPYDGGDVGIFGIERGNVLSAEGTLQFWVDRFHCSEHFSIVDYPNSALFDGTHITQVDYELCVDSTRISLMTIHGGGHTWASGWQYLSRRVIGKTSRDIDASDVIWEFFSTIVR